MNEKYQVPTLEQLRALLCGHPDLLHHIKSEKALNRAGRDELMELVDLCGLSINQVDRSDPHGLKRGLKNKPGKDTAAGRTNPDGFLQGDKGDPTYGQDADFVPFEITIEALGHKSDSQLFLNTRPTVISEKTKSTMVGTWSGLRVKIPSKFYPTQTCRSRATKPAGGQ